MAEVKYYENRKDNTIKITISKSSMHFDTVIVKNGKIDNFFRERGREGGYLPQYTSKALSYLAEVYSGYAESDITSAQEFIRIVCRAVRFRNFSPENIYEKARKQRIEILEENLIYEKKVAEQAKNKVLNTQKKLLDLYKEV